MPYANNKGTDQPAHLCSLISALIVHCLDSIIPLLAIAPSRHDWKIVDWDVKPQHKQTKLAIAKISRPYLVSSAEQTGKRKVWGGGTIYPGAKCPPPLNPHVCFHFYVMIKGIEKSLVIWSFWMRFKRMPIFLLVGGWGASRNFKWPGSSQFKRLPIFLLVGGWGAFRNFKWPGSSQSLRSLHKNESIHEGWRGGDTLPQGRLSLPPPPPLYWLCS